MQPISPVRKGTHEWEVVVGRLRGYKGGGRGRRGCWEVWKVLNKCVPVLGNSGLDSYPFGIFPWVPTDVPMQDAPLPPSPPQLLVENAGMGSRGEAPITGWNEWTPWQKLMAGENVHLCQALTQHWAINDVLDTS